MAATIYRDLDTRNHAAIAKVVSAETVQRIGRELAALHRPMTVHHVPNEAEICP